MKLYEALKLELDKGGLISLVGGGGKTTTMFKLAGELKDIGKRVLVTTTTAIFEPKGHLYDRLIILKYDGGVKPLQGNAGHITVLGKEVNREGKLLGIDPDEVNMFFLDKEYDFVIVEADGSKGRPIKAPAQHEPVIPHCTTAVIGVIGLDALGRLIDEEAVHRPHIFAAITEGQLKDVIDEERIFKLILHEEGLFKGTPEKAKRFLLLNKEDQISKEELNKLVAKLKLIRFKLIDIIIASHLTNSIKRWSDLVD